MELEGLGSLQSWPPWECFLGLVASSLGVSPFPYSQSGVEDPGSYYRGLQSPTRSDYCLPLPHLFLATVAILLTLCFLKCSKLVPTVERLDVPFVCLEIISIRALQGWLPVL